MCGVLPTVCLSHQNPIRNLKRGSQRAHTSAKAYTLSRHVKVEVKNPGSARLSGASTKCIRNRFSSSTVILLKDN